MLLLKPPVLKHSCQSYYSIGMKEAWSKMTQVKAGKAIYMSSYLNYRLQTDELQDRLFIDGG